MWPRLKAEDFRIIFHYLGYLVVFTGVAMLIPLGIALAQNNTVIAVNYIIGIGASFSAGFLMCMLKINIANLKRRQAVVITSIAWLVCSLFAAIPLYLSGHYATYFDSVFEGMSSFTTTGFSMCVDIEHMSLSDIMWRFILMFIGGQGIVVVALSIGAFVRSGSRASLYYAEGRHDHVMPEIKQTVRFIGGFSIAVVLIGGIIAAVILVIKGFSPKMAMFHGIGTMIAAYVTGGFTVNSVGVTYYHSWVFEILLIVVMLIGSISLALFIRAFKGRLLDFFKNYELRVYAVWTLAILAGFITMLLVGNHFIDLDTLLRKGVFTLVSASTSCGFSALTSAQLGNLVSMGAFMMLACAMAVGGMSESMAGGMKVIRLGVLAKDLVMQIKQVLSPDSTKMVTTYENLGKKTLEQSAVRVAAVILVLYIASFIVGMFVGVACGYRGDQALFESISATSNNGLTMGIASYTAPLALKITYFIQMWLGRLEFLSVLATIAALVASLRPVGRSTKQ